VNLSRRTKAELLRELEQLRQRLADHQAVAHDVRADTTQRTRAEAAVRESEELLRLLLEHTPAAVAMFDREMRYLLHSRRWLTDYQLGESVIIGRSHYEIFPEIPERWKEVHRRCLAGAVERCEEDPFPRLDGRTDWVRWEIRPWRDRHGQVGGLTMFTEVVTERKEAEKALQKERDLTAAVLDTAGALVVVLDGAGRIVRYNRACEQTSGYTFAEVRGRVFWDFLLLPEEAPGVRRVFEKLRRGQFPNQYENYWVAHDGSRRLIAWSNTALVDRGGAVEYIIGTGLDVTEHRQAEQTLRDSEARLRQIIDLVPHFVFAKDRDGRFILVNQAVADTYGCTVDELIGKTDADYARSDAEVRHFRSDDLEVIDSGRPKLIAEESITDHEGRVRFLQTTKIPFTAAGTGSPAVLGVAIDITERKEIEQARQRNEELIRQVVNASPNCVFVKDSDGRFLLVNEQMAACHGTTPEQMSGKTDFDLVGKSIPHRSHAERFRRDDREVLRRRQAKLLQDEAFKMPDGSLRWHQTMKKPISLPGLGDCILGVAVDVTERKQTEQAIRDSEERFRSLFEAAFEAIVVHSDGIILDANPAMEKLLGYQVSELVGRPVMSFVAPESRARVAAMIRTGASEPYEAYSLGKDGRIIDVDVVGRDYTYRGRSARVTALRDITERKRAEEALRHADRMAALGTLVAGVAHELNNPLMALGGLAELLARNAKLPSSARELAAGILEQSTRCSRIVSDLLDFSRSRAVEHQPVQVNDLLKRCLALSRPDSRFAGVELVEDYDPTQPLTLADPYRLDQVFLNIIRNARDALQNVPGPRRFEIRTSGTANELRIDFIDTGPGISDPERVFDPFYTTKGTEGGAGLGLSVSFGIIREHGGRITACNQHPGARFTIHLPVRTPLEPRASARADMPESRAAVPRVPVKPAGRRPSRKAPRKTQSPKQKRAKRS